MNVYAISDLHLSFSAEKPMAIFGANWEGHFEKIKADWQDKVKEEDIVLIPGDISWAMKLDLALVDLQAIASLPGRKVFVKGNHDYWWNGIGKLRDLKPDETFYFLQNDCAKIDDYIFIGSRGWTCPGNVDYTAQDEKLYHREGERFKLAFTQLSNMDRTGAKVVALIHYPPFNPKGEDTLFTQIFEENKVDKVVFGHIHGASYFPYRVEKNGIEYHLCSCDKIGFKLLKIY